MTYQFLESVSFVPFWGGDQLEKIFFEMLKKDSARLSNAKNKKTGSSYN